MIRAPKNRLIWLPRIALDRPGQMVKDTALFFRSLQANPMTRHTLSVLVENKFGVLARVAGMFSGRGYNIHTLNVGPTHDPKMSRMTIVVREKEHTLNQIIKQLEKLVDVIEVVDFREGEFVNRELVLLQVAVDRDTRAEVIELCQIFRAKITDVGIDKLTIEITGDQGKIDKFVALMENFGIVELARTGRIALPRA